MVVKQAACRVRVEFTRGANGHRSHPRSATLFRIILPLSSHHNCQSGDSVTTVYENMKQTRRMISCTKLHKVNENMNLSFEENYTNNASYTCIKL